MIRTSTFLVAVFYATVALAQVGDEWSSPFPAKAPTPPAAAPAPVARPVAPPDAGVPAPKAVAPVVAPAAAPAVIPAAATAPAARPAAVPTPVPAAAARPASAAPSSPASPAAARPATASPVTPPTAMPAGLAQVDGGVPAEMPIVSREEKFLPGTEPHSPATWSNKIEAPGNARVTTGQVGIGGAYVPSARLGPEGIVRVGFLAEYLNQTDFPVRNAQDIRSAIAFNFSWQVTSWGEVFMGYHSSANTNNRTAPNLIQALGDLSLGFKASRQWARGFWAGGDVRLLTFSGVGNQGIDHFALGVRPTLLATYDVRAAAPKVPVILTANLGFTFDNTAGLLTQKLNASEEFALSINKYHRFNFALLAEVPLPVVTPFLEYALAMPLGVPNGVLKGPDGSDVQVGAAMPQTLGLGLKVTAVKDLTLTGGVNIGLAQSVGLGVPATAPWNLYLGAAFAIDPSQRGDSRQIEIVKLRTVEKEKKVETARLTRIEGLVTDAETKKPIQGAVVANGATLPSASDAMGGYQTLDISAPRIKVLVTHEGYKPFETDVALDAAKPTRLDVALTPDVKKAVFQVSATAAKKPVKAQVSFKGNTEETLTLTEADTAPRKLELSAGTWNITVSADGFLSQVRDVQVLPAGVLPVTFDLQPAPKKALVIFKGDKLEILQQVHFETGKARIMGDSFGLLAQVVDVAVKNNIKKLRVEGHTDNRGVKEANQKLSEDRARAVIDYLVLQGIDPARVESAGYGDSKPVAPNLTARGRELNRRVEFLVLEK